MTDVSGKTVLLTGATGGFGREFAVQLAQKGSSLILTDLDEGRLLSLADELSGSVAGIIPGNLDSIAGIEQLFGAVMTLDRPVDLLINNAGIALMGRHDEVPQPEWERLIQLNLLAPMRLCSLLTPYMIERKQGHIVNIGSVASWTPDNGLSAYSASKFGLRGFTMALHDELNGYGIQVSCVYPFYSRTPILESPQYGSLANDTPLEERDLTGVTQPADVVAAAIAGIERNDLHIFPDRMGRIIYTLQRLTPGFFEMLRKRMSRTTG